MKLRIRYDEKWQVLELDTGDIDKLWISLDLEDENLTQEEKEARIQEAFEEQFNKPEYNNMHQFDRYRGYSKARPDRRDDFDATEPLLSEVRNQDLFWKDEIDRWAKYDYEEKCAEVRSVLSDKPRWAEAFIAVRFDGMREWDYALSIGEKFYNVSKWLSRAEKKLKVFSQKTANLMPSHGYLSGGNENA